MDTEEKIERLSQIIAYLQTNDVEEETILAIEDTIEND